MYQSSPIYRKFVLMLMREGKRTKAEGVLKEALQYIHVNKGANPLTVMYSAVAKVQPALEIRSMRIRGSTYQVPVPVDKRKQVPMAMRWMIREVRRKKGGHIGEKLGEELWQASQGQGETLKFKKQVAKAAVANRAYAHFRWF
ncbi:unnamed protein product [Chrysoparadoxa australica]